MSAGEIIVISGPKGCGKTRLGDALMRLHGRPNVERFEWPRDSHSVICRAYQTGKVCIVETLESAGRVPIRANLVIGLRPGTLKP